MASAEVEGTVIIPKTFSDRHKVIWKKFGTAEMILVFPLKKHLTRESSSTCRFFSSAGKGIHKYCTFYKTECLQLSALPLEPLFFQIYL